MRQDFFTFTPLFKLVFVGNHRPVLRNVDDAARRRFNIVPFTHKPTEPDLLLPERLKTEWPAILRWAIEGCLDWQQNGLVRPAIVSDATNAYFETQDVLGQWLDEKCERTNDPVVRLGHRKAPLQKLVRILGGRRR
jgi:putative DNA primase/helicase